MELPNNMKVAAVIADAVEALNLLRFQMGEKPLDSVQVASLWNKERALALLNTMRGEAMKQALLTLDPKLVSDITDIRDTFLSMFTAYALHLRGDKDEVADYKSMLAYLKTRNLYAEKRPDYKGSTTLAILKSMLEAEGS